MLLREADFCPSNTCLKSEAPTSSSGKQLRKSGKTIGNGAMNSPISAVCLTRSSTDNKKLEEEWEQEYEEAVALGAG